MNKMIECKNVVFKYSTGEEIEKLAIDGLNLEVNEGEFLVVLGHNGSGKSTVAKHMNALLVPTEGTVIVNGLDTSDENNVWDIRATAGMVFLNRLNVYDNIALPLKFWKQDPHSLENKQRIEKLLKLVGLEEKSQAYPRQLSGGQKQRVAIAGILAIQPKCIIFDEPTAMLDPSGRREVMENIKELNKKHGITVILITHYMDEAAQADRVVVMDKGKVIMEGIPRDIFSEVETMKKIGLDVPQVTEICYELKKAGINIDTKILNVNEMVNALCQLK